LSSPQYGFISIFVVFLVLSNKKITNIKVAQHIKLPYGNNSGNIENIKADFKPYKRTYNSMYYLKKAVI